MLAVRDQHPLKQGLRQQIAVLLRNILIVRDQHPLKQGLRRAVDRYLADEVLGRPRPTSTKTRIKTAPAQCRRR